MYFKKLDIQIFTLDLSSYLQKVMSGSGTSFVEQRVSLEIISELKKYFVFKFYPNLINLTTISFPGAPPHRDNFNSALNIYLECDKEITTFYKESFGDKVLTHYNENDLTSDLSFSVDPGDCYILDTSRIHGVRVNKKILQEKFYDCVIKILILKICAMVFQ